MVDFTKLPVGTKVVCQLGSGFISDISPTLESYCVGVTLDKYPENGGKYCPSLHEGETIYYTADGKYHDRDIFPTLFLSPFEWPAQEQPEVFVKGQRVLVRDSKGCAWQRKYFSHYGERGQLCCFVSGQDEWASQGETMTWKYVKPWVE
jgi:hypothetical protein